MNLALSFLLAPLLIGLINKTKAWFGGRCGASVFQLYFDLFKLARKGAMRSTSATWIFAISPMVGLVTTVGAMLVFPLGGGEAMVSFTGDVIFFFYLLGAGRFFTVLSARDVASAFPDMGSAREVQFSAIVEAVVFAVIAFLALMTGDSTLSGFLRATAGEEMASAVPLALAAVAAFGVMLSENCRVPFDDPETHLELTMIHEAMILDNSGPDLALILYTAALKLWLFAGFVTMLVLPIQTTSPLFYVATLGIGVIIGAVESSFARMRFKRTPFVLACAFACAVLAFVMEALAK